MWWNQKTKLARPWFQSLQDELKAPVKILKNDIMVSESYLPGIKAKFPGLIVMPPGYDADGYPIVSQEKPPSYSAQDFESAPVYDEAPLAPYAMKSVQRMLMRKPGPIPMW